MTEIWNESWFWPSLTVIVGLPIVLLVLSEVLEALVRRGNPAERVVRLIRNWIAPIAALLVLLSQVDQAEVDASWSRIVATVLGFLVILVLINGVNVALFATARKGTWRDRLPSIFIDVGRFLLIIISLALLFSWVWGADVGGLFTALGIGSIVIGLALQNAVGSVLSGLLLLFEQPFQLGDWLQVGDVRGSVVEVNWRSVHIRTVSGIVIVPNSELAGSSFRNFTAKRAPYTACAMVRFATEDPPETVIRVMTQTAADQPQLAPGATPSVGTFADGEYEINLPVPTPGDEYDALTEFRRRLWYAARRAGLHLDGDYYVDYDTVERRRELLIQFAAALYCTPERVRDLAGRVRVERYVEGERVQHVGEVPNGIRFVVSGAARMMVEAAGGVRVPVTELGRDAILGLTSLTRQGINAVVDALTEMTVLFVPVDVVDELVDEQPELARDFGREIDNRRKLVREAFAVAGLEVPAGSRAIAY
ncbi:MAG: mechanosensitive ion channel [Microcella sp.]|uniref:mechanosensitive ion channel family protein n=1 Tax=Microcella sp. TaxID=1913979 RepID=UPI0024C62529|nr:mechanosensitive ion channel family protein [Microcella sp.]UYN82752.1 MAG: mechanosensitive ion channel [Microcella sp.]